MQFPDDMKRGCVFFNFGSVYALRLLVAIFSLRRHYKGPVTVFLKPDAANMALRDDLAALGIETVMLPRLSKSFDRHRIFLESPYESTLSFDSDIIFRSPIDALWEPLEKQGVLLTRFYAPPYGVDGSAEKPGFGNRIALLNGVRDIVGEELHAKAVRRMLQERIDINIGVMGISRTQGSAFLADYAEHLERGHERRPSLLDEMLVVALAGRHPHALVAEAWNCPADEFFRRTNLAEARVIHYFAEGQSVHGIPLGRNRQSWAGKKWFATLRLAAAKIDLGRWIETDPLLGKMGQDVLAPAAGKPAVTH